MTRPCRVVRSEATSSEPGGGIVLADLAAFIESIGEAVFVTDSGHRTVFVNDAYCAMLGIGRERLIGQTAGEPFSEAQRQESRAQGDEVLETGERRLSEVEVRKGSPGESLVLSVVKTLYTDPAGRRFVVGLARDITARRRAEGQVALANRKNTAILRSVADGVVFLDREWRTVYVNAAGAAMSRQSPEELLHRSVWEAWPGLEATPVGAACRRAVAEGVPVTVEAFSPAPFESWLEVRCYPSPEGLSLFFKDVTVRKRAEQAAVRAKEEWEKTFNAVPDLIAIIGQDSRIVRVNRALSRRLGQPPEQCVGRHCYEVFHGLPYEPGYCPHALTLADGREHVAETYDERLGAYFHRSVTPILDDDGKMVGVVQVARDITEQKRIEKELQESAKLKSDLIALMNHEFANALTSMKLALALLRASDPGPLPEVRQRSYEALGRSVENLATHTTNFLNLNRLESGRFDLKLEPVAVRAAALGALATLRPLAEAKRLRMSLAAGFPEEVAVAVRADRDCLALIVNNLVTNAVKYTPDGGAVTIRIALEGGPPAQVRFCVEDTGIGISAPDMVRIRSGFYRTPEGRRLANGFGVGLMVVEQLLAMHASRIEIESQPGQGSRFSFQLPVWSALKTSPGT